MSGSTSKDRIPETTAEAQSIPGEEERRRTEGGPSLKRPHPSQRALPNRRLIPRTNQENFQDVRPSYFWEGGLRHVHPYTFEYQTYAKERWWGRTLLEVLTREFRDRPPSYYQAAILHQLITLNHQCCKLDTRVRANDLLAHQLHRHEPPVSGEPIRILAEGEGLLVVDKPGSLPVHPSGRYRFNTLVEILRRERGYQHLSVINRLDRLTSGVCLLATNPLTAERLHQQMEDRQLRKEYVARVAGIVPWERMTCQEPLRVIEHKLGLVAVSSAGKAAHTEFIRLAIIDEAKGGGEESSDAMANPSSGRAGSTSTLLLCRPFTGRTHQIRVHLQHLGHPIVNDTLYNHPIWREGDEEVEESTGEQGGEKEEERTQNQQQAKDGRLQRIAQQLLAEVQEAEGDRALTDAGDEHHIKTDSSVEISDPPVTAMKAGDPKAFCPECRHTRNERRLPDQLCIYLHAWRYASPTWSYETDTLPAWAIGITPEMLRRAAVEDLLRPSGQ